jgi:aryl-alcohol dehydrogenase-like predicted oxidoreductase
VIATKAAAAGGKARGGEPLTSDSVRRACEASLKRLNTDYIDLYQFHWPDRGSYHFRQNWKFNPEKQPDARAIRDNMLSVMGTLGDLVKEGKIRAFGLSNDSAWGTMEWLRAARDTGGPRVSTMQNEYSLLCRLYDTDMAELGHHEDIMLIAFTPLAGGYLSGKYADDNVPPDSRLGQDMMGGRDGPRVREAVDLYLDIARRHGLDPVHMALAWLRTRPFPALPIFGAKTMEQLNQILAGLDVRLSKEVTDEIDRAHKTCPMPF